MKLLQIAVDSHKSLLMFCSFDVFGNGVRYLIGGPAATYPTGWIWVMVRAITPMNLYYINKFLSVSNTFGKQHREHLQHLFHSGTNLDVRKKNFLRFFS